jgi:hypothetical protein
MNTPSNTTVTQKKRILLGFATVLRDREGGTHFRVAWVRLFVASVTLAIMGWIGLFSAVYVHFKYRRGYEDASYFETLVLPFHRKDYERKRGLFYIDSAYTALESGDLRSSLHLFRNGLIRKPDHLAARLTLAEFYEFIFNRPKLALDLLYDGIRYLGEADPEKRVDYIQQVFQTATRNQLDESIRQVAEKLLDEHQFWMPEETRLLTALHLASASRNLAETHRARGVIRDYHLDRLPEGQVLHAQLLWDQGQEDLALTTLEEHLDVFRNNRVIYERLIQLLREQNRTDRALRFSLLYEWAHPDHHQSRFGTLSHYYEYGAPSPEAINARVDDFLSSFRTDGTAIRQLAILASKYGDTFNVEKILSEVLNGQGTLDATLARLIVVESALRAGQYLEALDQCLALEEEYKSIGKSINPDSESILHSLKAACYHGLGRPADVEESLLALFRSPAVKLDRYLAVAYLFLDVEAPHVARRVLEHCIQTQQYNQNVMEAMIAIHIKSGDASALCELLPVAMNQRRLPNRMLASAYHLLVSDSNRHLHERSAILERIESYFVNDYLYGS